MHTVGFRYERSFVVSHLAPSEVSAMPGVGSSCRPTIIIQALATSAADNSGRLQSPSIFKQADKSKQMALQSPAIVICSDLIPFNFFPSLFAFYTYFLYCAYKVFAPDEFPKVKYAKRNIPNPSSQSWISYSTFIKLTFSWLDEHLYPTTFSFTTYKLKAKLFALSHIYVAIIGKSWCPDC